MFLSIPPQFYELILVFNYHFLLFGSFSVLVFLQHVNATSVGSKSSIYFKKFEDNWTDQVSLLHPKSFLTSNSLMGKFCYLPSKGMKTRVVVVKQKRRPQTFPRVFSLSVVKYQNFLRSQIELKTQPSCPWCNCYLKCLAKSLLRDAPVFKCHENSSREENGSHIKC